MTKFRNLKEELAPENGVVFNELGSMRIFGTKLNDLGVFPCTDDESFVKVIADEENKIYLERAGNICNGYEVLKYDGNNNEYLIDTKGEFRDEVDFKIGKVYKLEETEEYSKIFEIVGVKLK